jgi:hypothetical protein
MSEPTRIGSALVPELELELEAAAIAARVDTLTNSPAALLLPAPVRQAIRDLARMVQRLAVEVQQCKAARS